MVRQSRVRDDLYRAATKL